MTRKERLREFPILLGAYEAATREVERLQGALESIKNMPCIRDDNGKCNRRKCGPFWAACALASDADKVEP